MENISVDQVGIVVHDLHQWVENFKQLFGEAEFRIFEWPIEGIDPKATYHGEPGNFKLLLAFGTIGNCQLEIVQPLEGQNIYSDFLESHGPGLHHIRLTVPDFEARAAALQAAGIEKIASGTGMHHGSEWAYFDTSALLGGLVVELRTRLEGTDGAGQWLAQVENSGNKP